MLLRLLCWRRKKRVKMRRRNRKSICRTRREREKNELENFEPIDQKSVPNFDLAKMQARSYKLRSSKRSCKLCEKCYGFMLSFVRRVNIFTVVVAVAAKLFLQWIAHCAEQASFWFWWLHQKSFEKIKNGPVIFFGNEFFDAIPVKQFSRKRNLFMEKCYSLNKKNKIDEIYKKASDKDIALIKKFKILKNFEGIYVN